jgi:lactoylglutathione lyase
LLAPKGVPAITTKNIKDYINKETNMGNYKMAHTMIRVLDLDRALEFYKEALGFEEVKRRDEPTYEFTLVFLGDGNPNGHQLELTYNYGQVVPYQPTQPKGLSGDGKPRYYFITDPDGYKIEIIRN